MPTPGPCLALLCALVLSGAACHAPARAARPILVPSDTVDRPVARPPYDRVAPSWKDRQAQPYVYVELVGPYARGADRLDVVLEAMRAQGLEPAGPPFGLYYDDPGRVPATELRSRACVPIQAPREVTAPLRCDVLAGQTVVYAFVAGKADELPRAYPALFDYLERLRWVEDGPLREVYLVPPPGRAPDELLAEIQVPARAR